MGDCSPQTHGPDLPEFTLAPSKPFGSPTHDVYVGAVWRDTNTDKTCETFALFEVDKTETPQSCNVFSNVGRWRTPRDEHVYGAFVKTLQPTECCELVTVDTFPVHDIFVANPELFSNVWIRCAERPNCIDAAAAAVPIAGLATGDVIIRIAAEPPSAIAAEPPSGREML